MKLRIGILGTRGVPNQYGGFEQFASYLSKGLVEKGHEVSVYNPHHHSYKKNIWEGVQIIHCYDPDRFAGTAAQFIYDLNCILDARKKKFDILLVLGYTSSSVWGRWYPEGSVVITNMDGLEWKRSKYSAPVKRFLRYAEKLAVKFSAGHVADSLPIQEYLYDQYKIQAHYISYGAELALQTDESILAKYGVLKGEYFLVIARMEPENNIETILEGFCEMHNGKKVLIIGETQNRYGKKMIKKFAKQKNIHFPGTIYDPLVLNTLRSCCSLYFHGHSVGGTNPSLLEAMASKALICAHDNVFNRAVLGNDAFYFTSETDIANLNCNDITTGKTISEMIDKNYTKIRDNHSWRKIIDEYETLFIQSYHNSK